MKSILLSLFVFVFAFAVFTQDLSPEQNEAVQATAKGSTLFSAAAAVC